MNCRGGRTSCRAPAMPTALVTTEASAGRFAGMRWGSMVMANTIAAPTEKASRRPFSCESTRSVDDSCVNFSAGYGEGMATICSPHDTRVGDLFVAHFHPAVVFPPSGGLWFLRVRRAPPDSR